MAGILMHEGIGKGAMPLLDILTVGSTVSTRQSNDLLPYIPKLRTFFTQLPKTGAEMSIRRVKVPLADVECFTKTVLKVSSA